jgi:hypothetical protein
MHIISSGVQPARPSILIGSVIHNDCGHAMLPAWPGSCSRITSEYQNRFTSATVCARDENGK